MENGLNTAKGKKPLPLHIKIILGLIAGVIWALAATNWGLQKITMDWVDPFGKIFIRLLKLIAVPLVLFSIIKGVAGLPDIRSLGRMGAKTMLLYLLTTVTAVSLGLTLVNLVKPGKMADDESRLSNRINYEVWAEQNSLKPKDGRCFSCLPENIALKQKAVFQVSNEPVDEKIQAKIKEAGNMKNTGPLQPLIDLVPENIFLSLNNMGLMLQVIFFAVFFGIALVLIDPSQSGGVMSFVSGSNEVFLKMVDLVMDAAPYFVFALTAGVLVETAGNNPGKMLETFKALGTYMLVVVLGLGTMLFVFYPTLMKLFTSNFSYRKFYNGLGPAQLLAFSSSSSAATLPVTMDCVNNNLKVPKTVTDFVLPIGATVNMDGTSLYQAVAVIFLAQFHMIDLDLGQQITIVITATLASIGSAAVPSAGLVMLILVLGSVGLNPAWIAIVLPVDRILDMCRTVVNVTSDATVSALVARSEGLVEPEEEKES